MRPALAQPQSERFTRKAAASESGCASTKAEPIFVPTAPQILRTPRKMCEECRTCKYEKEDGQLSALSNQETGANPDISKRDPLLRSGDTSESYYRTQTLRYSAAL